MSKFISKDIIIIGAGPAGMACSVRLAQLKITGHFGGQVRLLEKEEIPGGRSAALITNKHYFDYGIQRFKVPDIGSPWHTTVSDLRQEWKCSEWGNHNKKYDHNTGTVTDDKINDTYMTLVPSTRIIHKHLFAAHSSVGDLSTSSPATRIQMWERDQWIIQAANKKWFRSDGIVIAAPPSQILPLFSGNDEFPLPECSIMDEVSKIQHKPIVVLIIGWDNPGYSQCDVLTIINHPVLSHIYDNNSKEGRPKDKTSLTVVCTAEFSEKHFETDETQLAYYISDQLSKLSIMDEVPPPQYAACHMWKNGYHTSTEPLSRSWDPESGLGFAGDWTLGENTLEAAWNSGIRLANTIVNYPDVNEIGAIRYKTFQSHVVNTPTPTDASPGLFLWGKKGGGPDTVI